MVMVMEVMMMVMVMEVMMMVMVAVMGGVVTEPKPTKYPHNRPSEN
tara:strand:- start:156 stop:293 length:138 start_codon:yes stop_codon:yes gene_type:complete